MSDEKVIPKSAKEDLLNEEHLTQGEFGLICSLLIRNCKTRQIKKAALGIILEMLDEEERDHIMRVTLINLNRGDEPFIKTKTESSIRKLDYPCNKGFKYFFSIAAEIFSCEVRAKKSARRLN